MATKQQLQQQLETAEKEFARSKEFYQKARAAASKRTAEYNKLREQALEYRESGRLTLARETEEHANALYVQVDQLNQQRNAAKEVADQDYAKVEQIKEKLKALDRVLPGPEVRRLAEAKAAEVTTKIARQRGIPVGSQKYQILYSKEFDKIYASYAKMNQEGKLSA